MKSLCYVILLMLAFLLTGCLPVHKSTQALQALSLVPGKAVHLPALASLKTNLSASQVLQAHYAKGKTLSAEVHLELSASRFVIVAFGGWGGEVFSLEYNGKQLKTSHLPMPHAKLAINNMLRDFMFTYAPVRTVRTMLAGTGVKLSVTKKKRTFMAHGQPYMRIRYSHAEPWRGTIHLRNYVQHYRLSIKTVTVSHHGGTHG